MGRGARFLAKSSKKKGFFLKKEAKTFFCLGGVVWLARAGNGRHGRWLNRVGEG